MIVASGHKIADLASRGARDLRQNRTAISWERVRGPNGVAMMNARAAPSPVAIVNGGRE